MSIANTEERDLHDEDAIVCICDSDIDDNGTIQCDRCGRWQHMRCVGIDPRDVDLDDLVYYCDRCQPRPLDVDAAKAYIERYKEEAQSVPAKPRRGRGKGPGRRVSANNNEPVSRPEARRTKSQKGTESDDPVKSASPGPRIPPDLVVLENDVVTDRAKQWMDANWRQFTVSNDKPIPDEPVVYFAEIMNDERTGSIPAVFIREDKISGEVLGRYTGLVDTKDAYKENPTNQFESVRGPLNFVMFPEDCDLVVDSRKSGNVLRYIRKSCAPNCVLVPQSVAPSDSQNQKPGLCFLIKLLSNVMAGDEITIGYQWAAADPKELVGLESPECLEQFAHDVEGSIGVCACRIASSHCSVRKWLSTSRPVSSKRSMSREAKDNHTDAAVNGNSSSLNTADVPMTREERKIQMAIARMENADAPKAKRRRRNTEDENGISNNRRSNIKSEEDNSHHVSPPRSPSPPPQAVKKRPIRSFQSKASLIRSPSPSYEESSTAPRKISWLRTFAHERAIKEEQRQKLAEQAKEATARLAEEATRKKLEIETQARLAREAKEKEEELRRQAAEREAREAMQRAREREIWGDHSNTAGAGLPSVSSSQPDLEEPAKATHVTTDQNITKTAQSAPEVQTEMRPPTVVKEPSESMPSPAPIIPKIVRKLSVSEYLRQKQERKASEASPSPTIDGFGTTRVGTEAVKDVPPEAGEQSEGEVEYGDNRNRKDLPPIANVANGHSQMPRRGEFVPSPPTAPKAPIGYQSTYKGPQGPIIHPSRQFPTGPSHHPISPSHISAYPRYPGNPDNRAPRPPNLGNNMNGNPATPHNVHHQPPFMRSPSVPTGPKYRRTSSNPEHPNT